MFILFEPTTPYFRTMPVPRVFQQHTEPQIRRLRKLGHSLMLTEGLNRQLLARKLGFAQGALNWLMQGLVAIPGKQGKRFQRYSTEEKALKLAQAHMLLDQGRKVYAVAAEIGVAQETLSVWLGQRRYRNRRKAGIEGAEEALPASMPAPVSDAEARERMARVRFTDSTAWQAY